MKLSTLAHCIVPSATSMPRLLAAVLIVIGLSHVPAKAIDGDCDPADYWCNPDGTWRWDPIKPDAPGAKPPSNGTEKPSDYLSADFANRSQSWYNPNNTYAAPNGYTGTRGGPATPPPPAPFQRAEIIRTKAVKGAADAGRQDGPCFNHRLLDGLTHVPPAGTHYYIGLNLSPKADPEMAQLLKDVLRTFLSNLRQFYGAESKTSLTGPTFAEQHPGVTPPKWLFTSYDTLGQAQTAAASVTEKNQIVFPISDVHSTAGSVRAFGRSYVDIDKSGGPIILKMEIEFELLKIYKEVLAQQYDPSNPLFTLTAKQLVSYKLLNRTLPHEFGHAVAGLEHQGQFEDLDDDGGPMPISGVSEAVSFDKVTSGKIASPLSFCAGVPVAANPAP